MSEMMNVKPWTELDLERAVHMRAMGVVDTQIMRVLQLSEETYEQLLSSAEFKSAYSEKVYNDAMDKAKYDSDWDAVEATALANLKQSLKFNKDPNLNLRAAAMSNRASRRTGSLGNQPLNADGGTGRVMITLNSIFVNQINNATPDTRREITVDMTKKRVNVMPQKHVNELFTSEEEQNAKDFAKLLEGVDIKPFENL